MRIFLAGDAVTGTGPANVTRYYIENLPDGTLFQKRRSRIMRVPEIVIKTFRSDVVVYSGYSKQNILGLRLAKLLNKPSAYLMHGCVEHENAINLVPDETMNSVERKTLELADLIIAVSKSFEDWLKENYPMHSGKIVHVSNGVDLSLSKDATCERDPHMILSVGGGMPRKMIKYICLAVKKLREEYDPDLFLCVMGDKGADSSEIDSYDLVDDRGIVSFEESRRLYEKASVFVQNSCFETFGLAPVEALMCGCSVLCSRHVGALEMITELSDADVIERYDDPDEIAEKIKRLLTEPNGKRLISYINGESCSWKVRSETLTQVLSQLVLKR